MPKPLRSETAQTRKVLKPLVSQTGQTEDIRFKDFGTLEPTKPNGPGTLASIALNVAAAFILVIIWKAAPPVVKDLKNPNLVYTKVEEPPPPPPKPVKLPPPPKVKIPPVEPPKVIIPAVKLPDPPKVEVAKLPPTPLPPVKPAPPKREEAPPAPKVMPVKLPTAASIPNHDKVPTPVRVGTIDSPVAPAKTPVATAVRLPTSGAPNMPGSNSGRGPVSPVPNLGSGQPSGQNMGASGSRNIQGVKLGVPGGTGNSQGNGNFSRPAQVVTIGQPTVAPPVTHPPVATISKAKPPQVLYQPKPAYTADATKNNIEGTIRVRIRVSATGQVTVIGIVGGGLGHGLDQNALATAQAIRFRPALDAAGNPTDWEGVVSVQFQIAT